MLSRWLDVNWTNVNTKITCSELINGKNNGIKIEYRVGKTGENVNFSKSGVVELFGF